MRSNPARARTKVSEAESETIAALIRRLAEIDQPDIGYSGGESGSQVAPMREFRLDPGQVGDFIEGASLGLDALERVLRASLPPGLVAELQREHLSSRDFRAGRAQIQLTEWPELGSLERGRIAPDGYLEPMFESIVANAGHY